MGQDTCSGLLTFQDPSLLHGNLNTQSSLWLLGILWGLAFIPHVLLWKLDSPVSFTFFCHWPYGSEQCLSALWMHDGGEERGISLCHTQNKTLSPTEISRSIRSTVQYSAGGCSQVTVANKNALVFTKVNLVHSGILLDGWDLQRVFVQAGWAALLLFSCKPKHPKILGGKIRVEETSGDHLVQLST